MNQLFNIDLPAHTDRHST